MELTNSTDVKLNRKQRKALVRFEATNAPKLLNISDASEHLNFKKKRKRKVTFPISFRGQVQKLILHESPPLYYKQRDFYYYFSYGINVIENPKRRCFHFYYCKYSGLDKSKEYIKYGNNFNAYVLNGQRALNTTKEQFKDHKWVGNTLEVPIKSKINTWCVALAVMNYNEEGNRSICRYMMYLQKEYA